MPGGQFTNLKAQARAMGLEDRWHEVARTYAEVNLMFGDIVKVTPSSKVVGDMALSMVSAGLTRADVEDPGKDVSFPESVIGMLRGDLGQPPGGFPEAIVRKALKGEAPNTDRPGASVPPADLHEMRRTAEEACGVELDDEDLMGYAMYPKVFTDYAKRHSEFGPVRLLPTPVFFYGMEVGDEVEVEIEPGKTLHLLLSALGEPTEDGTVKVFFELNGQPRIVSVKDRKAGGAVEARPKAEEGNPAHVAAPMPGVVASVAVEPGRQVRVGDLLLTIEAMKMETAMHAERAGTVKAVHAGAGAQVDAKDLLLEYES
jgi:pyruvate carboxylase